MRLPRWLSLLTALALAFSLALPAAAAETASPLLEPVRAYAGQFADLEDAWCAEEAVAVYESGLMDGTSADRFDIQSSLTYAQITVITARLHHLLTGGDGVLDKAGFGEPWYRPAQEYLTEALADGGEAAAYLLDDLAYLDNFADQLCDRYDFVWYLAAVLPEEALEPINHIPSLPDVTDADILRFYRAGILTGSDGQGTFDGFGFLTRGQAAAILARIADPARRVSFTLETPCYAREILGLEPETVMLTVDGWDVTAEAYLYLLESNIKSMENQQSNRYYDQYPQYYSDYLNSDFNGDFSAYLRQVHGIEATTAVDWNTPDKGGMTPADKVLQDTLDDVKEMAVLMSRQEAYPLTSAQQAEVEETVARSGAPYGFSADFFQLALSCDCLTENLAEQYRMTSAEAAELLAREGYVYAQYAAVVRANYESDEDARAAAQEVRQKLTAHLSDPEYVEFLLWKYSDSSDITADLLELDILSEENRKTVEDLGSDRVSPVLAQDGVYLVVVKRDPMSSRELADALNAAAAQLRLSQWAEEAQVAVSDAYEALDVAAVAQALAGLDF